MFGLKIKDKKIFGRGVYDMKFAIACYLQLLKDLRQNLKKYNFGVMITTDEEIGGFNGTKKILENGYRGRLIFLPDGGGDWNFEEKAKGFLHLLIEAKGKSIHGSKPWDGENAIETIFEFLKEIKEKFPKEYCKDNNHWHETINIGKIEGGRATNQVPDFARAWVDIRFPPEVNIKKIKSILSLAKNKFKNKIKITELVFGAPHIVDKNNKAIKIFSKIALEKFNIRTNFVLSHGSSDARFFAQYKIPVILIKPRGGAHHSENEWLDKEDLYKFYIVLKEFVQQVTKT
jgi:acetylornithine deacetylase/succinyl-diaminopimelate desuccinylase-like protein